MFAKNVLFIVKLVLEVLNLAHLALKVAAELETFVNARMELMILEVNLMDKKQMKKL